MVEAQSATIGPKIENLRGHLFTSSDTKIDMRNLAQQSVFK